MNGARNTTLIDLIRHGEPVGGKRYRGQTDDPLDETGWRQMREAVAGCACWDVIITSPLLRCSEFARELATQLTLSMYEDERLKEIGFGEWEGCRPDELSRDDPGILERFWRDPDRYRPAGAETLADFRDRVQGAWEDLVREHEGKRVLVVAHAGVIRMAISLVLGMPSDHAFRIRVDNAQITRIRIERDSIGLFPTLVFHGGKP